MLQELLGLGDVMEIIIGKYSGFCNGVSNTIKRANLELDKDSNIYCLGEIVHNERVIEMLEDKGMKTVDDINLVPDNARCIFRAHGERREIYEEAKRRGIDVIDLSCGKVIAIRKKIEKKKDSFVILIGKKNHPEVIGNFSFATIGDIVENSSDIDSAIDKFRDSGLNNIYVCGQTTFEEDKFLKLVDEIKEKINSLVEVDNTICSATHDRQEETKELSKRVDLMLIVGGKNSSNTKELYNISNNNVTTYLIQDVNDLDNLDINYNTIGIMGGASTPDIVINEIVNYLKR